MTVIRGTIKLFHSGGFREEADMGKLEQAEDMDSHRTEQPIAAGASVA